jgi:hypothetical protein
MEVQRPFLMISMSSLQCKKKRAELSFPCRVGNFDFPYEIPYG